jgi:linoleate 9S-lipoxygenase
VLVKKDALSLGHFQASLLDGIHQILGQDTGLAFQLVSATKADRRNIYKLLLLVPRQPILPAFI